MPWAGPPAIRLTAEAGGFEPSRLRKKIPQRLINGPYSNHNRFTRFKKVAGSHDRSRGMSLHGSVSREQSNMDLGFTESMKRHCFGSQGLLPLVGRSLGFRCPPPYYLFPTTYYLLFGTGACQ